VTATLLCLSSVTIHHITEYKYPMHEGFHMFISWKNGERNNQ